MSSEPRLNRAKRATSRCPALPSEVKGNEVFVKRAAVAARELAPRGEPRGRAQVGQRGTIRGNQLRPPLSDSLRHRHEAVTGLPQGEGAGRDVFRAAATTRNNSARQPHDRLRGPWRRARRRTVQVLASRDVDPVRRHERIRGDGNGDGSGDVGTETGTGDVVSFPPIAQTLPPYDVATVNTRSRFPHLDIAPCPPEWVNYRSSESLSRLVRSRDRLHVRFPR